MKVRATIFGGLLNNYQREKELAVTAARSAINGRNKRNAQTEYRLEEGSIVTHDGALVYSVALWQKVDEEHVKISGHVSVETLAKAEVKDELRELLK